MNKGQGWLKAAFTVHKADVGHMSPDEFRAWALKRLPEYTQDINWMEQVAM